LWSVSDRFREFSFLQSIQTGYVACTVCNPRVLAAHSPGIKQMGHETDHSLPSSTKVHNYSAQISTPALLFIACTVNGKLYLYFIMLEESEL